MRKIDKFVYHHSATPFVEIDKAVKSFNENHRVRLYEAENQPLNPVKGKEYIAYHYLIDDQGNIETCRQLDIVGYHASNYQVNLTSIGICFIGNFDEGKPTNAQYISAVYLTKLLWGQFAGSSLHQHNEYAAKTCPGKNFDFNYFKNLLMEKSTKYTEILKEEIAKGYVPQFSEHSGDLPLSEQATKELIDIALARFERTLKK